MFLTSPGVDFLLIAFASIKLCLVVILPSPKCGILLIHDCFVVIVIIWVLGKGRNIKPFGILSDMKLGSPGVDFSLISFTSIKLFLVVLLPSLEFGILLIHDCFVVVVIIWVLCIRLKPVRHMVRILSNTNRHLDLEHLPPQCLMSNVVEQDLHLSIEIKCIVHHFCRHKMELNLPMNLR